MSVVVVVVRSSTGKIRFPYGFRPARFVGLLTQGGVVADLLVLATPPLFSTSLSLAL